MQPLCVHKEGEDKRELIVILTREFRSTGMKKENTSYISMGK